MTTHDIAIIGGGAAGLSAALVLGRARRRVVVIDGGEPRNAPAAHMHAFLSRDGLPPTELLEIGRAEVAKYGVEIIGGFVEKAEPGFSLRLTDGRELSARRLLVATGLRDGLPELPGFRELWGKDVFLCPYCHGYEVRDQPIGVLAAQPHAVEHALLIREWSADLVFFANDSPISGDDRTRLEARGIRIADGGVTGLRIRDGRLEGVEIGGRVVERSALFLQSEMTPNDDVLRQLGCEIGETGFAVVDRNGATSVPGVWAAGNVVDPRAQVIVAAGEAAVAAGMLNHDLVAEDTAAAVARFGGFTPRAERAAAQNTSHEPSPDAVRVRGR